MTNTPSPDEDRELIEWLRGRASQYRKAWGDLNPDLISERAADRLESLLSDRAKLEEALERIARSDYEPLVSEYGESFTAAAAQIARAVLNRSTDRG